MKPGEGRPGPLLVVDTATRRAVIALGDRDGTLLHERSWIAGYRHGEELLRRIETLLADANVSVGGLGGLVVGTGPGAFTGLRVGLATVKGLAFALRLPVVGVPTGEALLAAASAAAAGSDPAPADGAHRRYVLLQPAGPSDTVLSRPGERPGIIPGGNDPGIGHDERLVAVDLDGRVPEDAAARGAEALSGLAASLLRAGAARLAASGGLGDPLSELVPEYVTLPRGVRATVPETEIEITGAGSGR
jgi:tRNA threonylcarbamoyl adenosine modification protein YeaZ